jgi:hypothetical protein
MGAGAGRIGIDFLRAVRGGETVRGRGAIGLL